MNLSDRARRAWIDLWPATDSNWRAIRSRFQAVAEAQEALKFRSIAPI